MGSWEVAATLLGATEGPREASPAPQLGVREAGIADLTAALDPDSLSALWDKAKAMPLDQAIDYALQHLLAIEPATNLETAVRISATKHPLPVPIPDSSYRAALRSTQNRPRTAVLSFLAGFREIGQLLGWPSEG